MANLPSLLVFGSQAEFPSVEELQHCYDELIENPSLTDLRYQLRELPGFWQRLVNFDLALIVVPGTEYLDLLATWSDGKIQLAQDDKAPNHYTLAITVLVQITQYTRYLRVSGQDAQERVLGSLRSGGGIQGLCVGFLTAIAIASSTSDVTIGSHAALALRLAVAAGAYVDQDGQYSSTPTDYVAVAARWSGHDAGGVARLRGLAYISSINDASSVTVTLPSASSELFAAQASAEGIWTKRIATHGRFHTKRHLPAGERLVELFKDSDTVGSPCLLQVPVRDTATGRLVSEGSMIRIALENVLVNPGDWYTTIKESIGASTRTEQTIVYVSRNNCIPTSLRGIANGRILAINGTSAPSEGTSGCFGKTLNGSDDRLGKGNGTGINGHNTQNGEPGHRLSSNYLSQYPPHSIAVVGMAGRFPEADSLDDLWDLIIEGRSTVKPAPVERLGLPHTDNTSTKWWGNFLKEPERFDNKFFNKSSRQALAWDPQQRILLETIYEALESAGYFGASGVTEPRDYGCYIGAVMNNYYDNLSCHPATAYATVGTSRCYLSGAMSHHFGWTGPALTIDTACSSSLVAIHTACRAILSGDCSRAIAGGTNVISSPFDYQDLAAAGFLSPSGQCKPFDAAADGYCRGEGVGVVVIKRLSDALNENDGILGVIVGSAANQNHNCGAITAPDSSSQVDLFRSVAKAAGVEAQSVSYVEAHGTGTGVGDPVEVRCLRQTFGGPDRTYPLHFGSIKGNIGHTEATAGVAGLIKVLLMMRHRTITPQASHTSLNPKIPPLAQDQMIIAGEVTTWSAPTLLACVNSYGAAGSNSAVMVREAPRSDLTAQPTPLTSYPILISAYSPKSLSLYCRRLLEWLRKNREAPSELLSSLAFNLANRGNHALSHVFAFAGSSITEIENSLSMPAKDGARLVHMAPNRKPVTLVFGGQETVHIGLSETIYKSSKLFRQHLDSVDSLLSENGLGSIFPSMFQENPIQNTVLLHSALFTIQYASARSWIDFGLEVDAVVGHSFGFLTALCISGVLSLTDALDLVVGRASLVQTHWGDEKGSMLSMQATRSTVEEILASFVAQHDLCAEIACYNGPENHVVVCSSTAMETLQEFAKSRHVRTKLLNVSNGFHSRFTKPLLLPLGDIARRLQWNPPKIHLETTEELPRTSQPDFSMIAQHTRQPVFFQNAIERLTNRYSPCTWLEAGRGSSVLQLVKRSVGNVTGHDFHSPQLCSRTHAHDSLIDVTVDLWNTGYNVQYWPFHRTQKAEYQYLALPPYQFERTRHWLGFTRKDQTHQDNDDTKLSTEIGRADHHELLRFVKYLNGAETEAEFSIDPQSDRFQKMVNGHIMAGEPLAPASLFLELAASAALFLQHDTQGKMFVPSVDDLTMTSPIGPSEGKQISMILKRQGDTSPTWTFYIATLDPEKISSNRTEHVTGVTHLQKRDETAASRIFQRYDTLIGGARRYEELLNNPESEKMQGNHIYRAFSTVVTYDKLFHGIREIACLRSEAAGMVRQSITGNRQAGDSYRLFDTPLIDSFMQFAGFLVNYFHNPSVDDVFVCGKIDQITMGGTWDPDAEEWLVHSFMREEGGHAGVTVDVYVTDLKTGRIVMTAFGFHFSKMHRSTLGRLLKAVNQPGAKNINTAPRIQDDDENDAVQTPRSLASSSSEKRREIIHILSNVTDVPVEKIQDEIALDELRIDSLMAVEVLNDLRAANGLTINLPKFLLFPNIRALVDFCDEKLGLGHTAPVGESAPEPAAKLEVDASTTLDEPSSSTPGSTEPPCRADWSAQTPSIPSAAGAFEETRLNYDHHAQAAQASGFWQTAYPLQARLVLAYVVKAFADLGCDLGDLLPDSNLPDIDVLPRHQQLLRRLYLILEDGKLIYSSDDDDKVYRRTEKSVDSTPADTIYAEVIDVHPQHDCVLHLVKAMGSRMAACLRGETDPLEILFGDQEMKKLQEDLYEFWLLLLTPALVLADFLAKATTSSSGNGKLRILEIGAGTGGTTKRIVEYLQRLDIDFEYIVTDISSSLVNATAKHFAGTKGLRFERLDIEQAPTPDFLNAFHFIVATNCIHATKDLHVSLGHARQMLRDDGALALIEITQPMFWLDVVVGLLRGWWASEDGREYALVDERGWERRLREVGFGEVGWSDGHTAEAKTVRVIAAFPQRSREAAATPASAPDDNDGETDNEHHHSTHSPTLFSGQAPPPLTIVPTTHRDTYPFISPLAHPFPPPTTSVLITGASRGIGLATALSFARSGYSRIAILARSDLTGAKQKILAAASEANRSKPHVLELQADISDPDAVARCMALVKNLFGHIDILINNASRLSSWTPLGDSDIDDWWQTWEVNIIKGTYLVTRSALPLLLHSTLKTILTITSAGAFASLPGGGGGASAYQGTKAAQIKVTEDLMAEYASQGLLAYAVHPCATPTAGTLEKMPVELHVLLQETAELAGDTVVWLTRERKEWLAGRFVFGPQDMGELEGRRGEILERGLLRVGLRV